MSDDLITGTHCYTETLDDGEGGTIRAFLCGRLGPPCVQCGGVSEVLCDFPIGDEQRTCDRPLCMRCAPTVGADQNFCAEHMERGPGLLLFRRPKTRAEITAEARPLIHHKKPRLPKAPPPDRRWRVLLYQQQRSGDFVRVGTTMWMTELAARRFLKEHGGTDFGDIEAWDEFVADFRKRYPLAKRKTTRTTPRGDR